MRWTRASLGDAVLTIAAVVRAPARRLSFWGAAFVAGAVWPWRTLIAALSFD